MKNLTWLFLTEPVLATESIPGLGNLWTVEELEEEAYINSVSTVNPEGIIPHEDVPHLRKQSKTYQ